MNCLLMGIGNVLMADDAFGPYVINTLAALYRFPEEVELLELGTAGAELSYHLDGRDRIVAVDTVHAAGAPGSVHRFDRDQLLTNPVFPISQHEPGLKEALLQMQLSDTLPAQVTLIGVVPQRVETRVGLSPAIRQAVPTVVDAVLWELRQQGLSWEKKIPPDAPNVWWERTQ